MTKKLVEEYNNRDEMNDFRHEMDGKIRKSYSLLEELEFNMKYINQCLPKQIKQEVTLAIAKF